MAYSNFYRRIRIPTLNFKNSLTTGLVLCSPLFELGSTTVRDISKYHRNGSFVNTPTWTRYGLNFDATTDEINYGTNVPTLISQNVTVVIMWKKTDATARASVAFGTDYGANLDRIMHLHLPFADGNVYWQFGGNTGANSLSVTAPTFGDDIWIVTNSSTGMEIWQNGNKRASNSSNVTRNTTGINFFINNATGVLNGDLADCKMFLVYNRKLSPSEIVSISARPYQIFNFIPSPLGFVAPVITSDFLPRLNLLGIG